LTRSKQLVQRLRSALLTNWPVKLTALGLATVLWAAVAAEEPTTQIVPVNFLLEPPPGRTLTSPTPTVQAIYSGTTRELIKLYSSPPVIRREIPDTVSGTEYTFELAVEDLVIVGDIDVRPQEIQPRQIVATLDDVTRRTVRVNPRVQIVPEAGYALVGGVVVAPGRVTLQGPDSVVRSIRQVSTVPIRLTGVATPVRHMVELDTTGLAGARVVPAEVEISAEVAMISERVLMGVPVTVRSDRNEELVADPPAVIVTVRGPSGRLVHLTRDSVDVVAVHAAGGTLPDTVRLEVVAPAGVTANTLDTVVIVTRPRG